MIKIKVCGMTDPLNVKEVSESGPDYMGFIFYKGSPRYVGYIVDLSIFSNVQDGIDRVGVFVNEEPGKVLTYAHMANLSMIQLHGNESPDYCLSIRNKGLKTVKAFSITENFDFNGLNNYLDSCDYFLLDTKTEKHGGSGEKFNWDKLSEYNLDKPFFLSGGICPEDAEKIKAISNRYLFAIDVNSRFETTPGIKDNNLIKKFIDEIKNNK